MLVFTGFRLAAPQAFIQRWQVGHEQFMVFVSTVLGVLATDLLIGIAIGIGVNFVVHLKNGAPLRSLLKIQVTVERQEKEGVTVRVKDSAIFSTWIGLKKTLESLMKESNVVLDLSETFLVDHTVMTKLQEMQTVFQEKGSTLVIAGLDQHQRLSNHPAAARKKLRK